MAVVISVLRAVNLGPHNRLRMDELREVYLSLGLHDAKTYIQSGNVLFRTKKKPGPVLAAEIQKAIERKFGFHAVVILRTADDLRGIISRNPFAQSRDVEPNKLLVTFLVSEPPAPARERLLGIECKPEELRLVGAELYIYFPNGMGRPKLSMAALERAIQVPGTGRNWNTVLKLLAMAEEMERAG